MSGFAKLIPAFETNIVLDPAIPIGTPSSTGLLVLAPFITPNSYLRSVADYPVKLNATFLHGSDYIRADADGKHVRLDVKSVLKDESGAMVVYKYTGVINMNEHTGAVLTAKADAKTTDFGDIFTNVVFETGSDELRALENKVFVGSGRFIVEAGKPTIVEYKISEVSL